MINNSYWSDKFGFEVSPNGSISENKITNIINKAMENRTVIVIAHRLQTVMEANKIVVIEKGKVVETGNHSELLKQKGIYSSLVDLQRGVINE